MKTNKYAVGMAEEIKERYGYDMVLETYVNSNTKATFICPEHGEFRAFPGNVKRGRQNCKKCYPKQNYEAYYERTFADTQARSPYKIIKETYKGIGEKATFICPEHGEFEVRVQDVIGPQGQRCPVCTKVAVRNKLAMSKEEAQSKCKYEIVEYGGTMFSNSILRCEKHGEFTIDLAHVIHRGQGCPVCGQTNRAKTNLKRYGHVVPAHSKGKVGKKARRNRVTSRKQEDEVYDLLCKYTGLHFEREYRYTEDRRYKADFAVEHGGKTILVEFHRDWTHGEKPYNPKDKDCLDLVAKWEDKSDGKNYYANAVKQYTVIDPEKQAIAWANNDYLFLPFYTKEEVIDAFERTVSLKTVKLVNKGINNVVNYFQFDEKYKNEIEWFNGSNANKLLIYANRYKHHERHKRLHELSDLEIVSGIGSVAHFTSHYTGFNTKDLASYAKENGIKSVFDPFAGFGHRMLACARNGIDYEGCEINPATFDGLCRLADWLKRDGGVKTRIILCQTDGTTYVPELDYDLAYTCPPYYGREIYSEYGLENLGKPEFDIKFRELLDSLSGKNVRMVVSKNMLHLFKEDAVKEPYLQKKSHYTKGSNSITEWIVTQS